MGAVRLRELGSTYGGLTGKTKEHFGTGSAHFVTFLEVINNTRLRGTRLARVHVRQGERQNSVQRGDLLFNGSSETPEEVALSAVVDFDPDEYTYLNSFCFGFRLRSGVSVDPAFLAYFFRSPIGRELVASLAQGAIRYNIAKTQFMRVEIDLPSLDRQREVVEGLTDADEVIAGVERLIAKKQAVRQGMLQQLLTGRTRLPGFTEEWNWVPFPTVMTRLNAKKHQVLASDYASVGAVPVIDQGQRTIVGFTHRQDAKFDPGRDGVVVFGDHTCIVKFVDFPFAVGADGTQLLIAKPGHLTRFYGYALQADPVVGTGYNRHFKCLREKELPVPSRDEQLAISTALHDAEQEVAVLRERLGKVRSIKEGMMQQLMASGTCMNVEATAS